MATKVPTSGKRWSKDAKTLWMSVLEDYSLEEHHRVLLVQACQLLSRADAARVLIDKDGMTITDRYGGVKPHPLLAEERASVNGARLLLRELGLDFDGDGSAARTGPEEGVRIHRAKGYA